MGDTYDAPRDVEFREGSVYNYDPSYFRYKENGTYSFKGNKLILKNDTFYEEADYVFYDDDQLKIHCTYGWYIEDGKKVEEESYDEYIIIHRVNKFF